MDRRLDQALDSRRIYSNAMEMEMDARPALVLTHLDRSFRWPSPPPGTPIGLQIKTAYFNSRERLGIRDPARTWVGPSTNQAWRVFQGLETCTQLTGKHYLVAQEALARVVIFGSSNTINGVQWAAVFEQAVRDNGWVLTTESGRVKVVPKDKLQEYQRAGLVKVRN
jgi:hypothetical protein